MADAIRMAHPNEFDVWLKSPSRATISPENIWFDPSDERRPDGIANPTQGKDYINSFNGLPVDPLDNDDCYAIARPILDLLLHLCQNDNQAFVWVMRWLAIPLQKLGTKMDTALMFHGEMQGAGKSLFFDKVMSEIYGQYAVTLGQGQLESQYNDWVADKMYAVFEEIFSGADRYAHMGMVKQLITGKKIYIAKKYVSGWTQDNLVNAVFLSNDMMPLKLEQNDRRFMVMNPNAKLPEPIKQAVSNALDDPNKTVIRAFYQILMTYDLGEQNEHTEAPLTTAKERLISVSMPSWERFFLEWKGGNLPATFNTVLSYDLYRVYVRYCTRSGDRACTETKLLTYIGSQQEVQKERLWYRCAYSKTRKRAMFVVVPATQQITGTKEEWLGYRVANHHREMEVTGWGYYSDDNSVSNNAPSPFAK